MDGSAVAALVHTAPLVNKNITLDVTSPVPSVQRTIPLQDSAWEALGAKLSPFRLSFSVAFLTFPSLSSLFLVLLDVPEGVEALGGNTCVAFSADGCLGAVGRADGTVALWHTGAAVTCARVLNPHVARIQRVSGASQSSGPFAKVDAVAWSPRAFHVAAAHAKGAGQDGCKVLLWSLADRKSAAGDGVLEIELPSPVKEMRFAVPKAPTPRREAGCTGLRLVARCADASSWALDFETQSRAAVAGSAESQAEESVDLAKIRVGHELDGIHFRKVYKVPGRECYWGLSDDGRLFRLRETLLTDFPGPMYPVGYKLIKDNEPYEESEDEVDIVVDRSGQDLCAATAAQIPKPGVVPAGASRMLPTKYRRRIKQRAVTDEDEDEDGGSLNAFIQDLDDEFASRGQPESLQSIPLELRRAPEVPYSPRRRPRKRALPVDALDTDQDHLTDEVLRLLPRPDPEEESKWQRQRDSYRKVAANRKMRLLKLKPPKAPAAKAAAAPARKAVVTHEPPAMNTPPFAVDPQTGVQIQGKDVYVRAVGIVASKNGVEVKDGERHFWNLPFSTRGSLLQEAHEQLLQAELDRRAER
eukprot:scaffold2389_cov262-Pinguiococcus_pyrenoidosus.AAC.10